MPYRDLEDYGLIGNLETCALVSRDGSIDWLPLPYLESPSVFAALLDDAKGGRFQICPVNKYASVQSYLGETNILQTTFVTSFGTLVITDFMPVNDGTAGDALWTVLRRVECTRGRIRAEIVFDPRFDYARAMPAFELVPGGALATAGSEQLFLQSPFSLAGSAQGLRAEFELDEGERRWVLLHYQQRRPRTDAWCEEMLAAVHRYWTRWSQGCEVCNETINPIWRQVLSRSCLVLKLLICPETGAIAAAPTTSLPEEIGGERNWDYRFAWIRDSAFTIQALYQTGHEEEAIAFRRWLRNRVVRAPNLPALRVLYPLHDGDIPQEQELGHLEGYRGSRPVRIGNGAADQLQLDIFGEALEAVYETTRYGEEVRPEHWPYYAAIADYVCSAWQQPDSGIWEVRTEPRHFVYSKLMCWVALDRAIRIARRRGFEAPLARWRASRMAIRQAIETHGFNPRRNSFVQAFGDEDALDAANLLIPQHGFLPYHDPRVQGTIEATKRFLLSKDGLVYRYNADDGVAGGEGAFVLCSFWLVNALALSGRVEEAMALFNRLIRYVSPLGLLAEQVDPETGKQLGNFPQAFSHIGLINSVIYLEEALGKRHKGPMPVGMDHPPRDD
ncbi:MAG: glycoside hydrolase family 15 protein [Chloroflexota bacterium]|nr:glycoside hydrolase family 15 protein [Dehalococcoidia bacterium]MDW8252835.1 glycoside hydrolase family 15 protein [Chloroflexota bacterium]